MLPSRSVPKAAAPRALSTTDLAALWTEARLAYPLYAALAQQFSLAPLASSCWRIASRPAHASVFDRDLKWLDAIDEQLLAYQLRQVPSEILNASEASLRAFIQRQLRKANKTTCRSRQNRLAAGPVLRPVRA